MGFCRRRTGGLETFQVQLNRPRDQAQILENIELTDEAFGTAQPTPEVLNIPTASFTYYSADSEVVRSGLDRLEQTIPYLYGTCDSLGKVRILRPEKTVVFERMSPPDTKFKDIDGFWLKETIVTVSEDATAGRFVVVSILAKVKTGMDDTAGDEDAYARLLLILKQDHGQERSIVLPPPDFPRIFVQFPINETGFLPFNTVFESKFDTNPERNGIAMSLHDKELLKAALSAFPAMVKYAVSSGWESAHKLALIDVPNRSLGGEATKSEELAWWKKVIRTPNKKLSSVGSR